MEDTLERISKIMNDLTDVEGLMQSASDVLEALDEIYELRREFTAQKNVVVFKALLDNMCGELGEKIAELDRFLLDSKKDKDLFLCTILEVMSNA